MSARTIRCGSSTPSLTDWTLRRQGLRVEAKAMGRPGYAPGDLLALHLRLSEPGPIEPAAGDGVSSQHRGPLAVADLRNRTSRPSPISGATKSRGVSRRVPPVRIAVPTPRPVRPRVAGGRQNPHPRRSTTRIATSPALRCESSSAPTSGWKTTSSGSTRAMSRTARQAAAHARRTWPKRLRRSTKSAAVTKRCWPSSSEPARTRSR